MMAITITTRPSLRTSLPGVTGSRRRLLRGGAGYYRHGGVHHIRPLAHTGSVEHTLACVGRPPLHNTPPVAF